MPALPEIEVVRRDLEREVLGRRVRDAEVRPGSNAMKIVKRHGRRKDFQELLLGAKVDHIERVGTWLVFRLDNAHGLVVDLGPAGCLLKVSASEALAPHTHIVIGFTIGGQLRILDPQHSSEVFVASNDELEDLEKEQRASLDPLGGPLAWQQFSTLLQEREESMKALLMDRAFICGLGSMYSDEILFTAGLRHDRSSQRLSSQDVRRLYRALLETLQEAVKARGTTVDEHGFKDLSGHPGQYQLELKVFERDGQACRRCRSPVVRVNLNGGGDTYFCPQCQS